MKTGVRWTCARVALILAVLLFPLSARGQAGPDNTPTGAQGFVDNIFSVSDFDSINEFNGALTLPIRIGPEYPIGPKLKFQAMLVFSSKVWEHGGAFPAALDLSSQWPILSGDPALGPGWTFTAGKIVGCGDGLVRRCYARADGAQIMFFESGTDAQYRYFTTTDTSQYRLRQPLGGGAYTMWDGDGNEYQFNWQVSGYDALHPGGYGRVRDYNWGRDGYYLTQLIDPFGNKLTERASSGTSAGGVS